VSVRRTESRFRGPRGTSLQRRGWLAAEPERVLVVVHGFAEHSGRYDHFGAWFARRGCAVHAYDQQGHGLSQGRRGHFERFEHLLDDLEALLEVVRQEHPGLGVALVGHSMGGLVTAALLRERRPAVLGAVLSGPLLALSSELPRARIWAASALRRLLPRLGVDAGVPPEGLSRDPEVVRRYVEDPLVFRKMTVSAASEILDAVRRTAAGAAELEVPVLLLHGEEDRLCAPAGSRRFHDGLRAPGSALRIYPGLRHEIFNEPERERVFEDLLEGILAREAEGKGRA
jgi:alpha-beta hydrolase superfamily lysophospholipase